jgi:hypothetical protein
MSNQHHQKKYNKTYNERGEMKKEPTEKQIAARKKLGEAAKARAAAKKLAKEQAEEELVQATTTEFIADEPVEEVSQAPEPTPATAVPGVSLSNEQFEMLLNRFAGMANEKKADTVGVIERFPVTPANYTNPVEELMDLPKFRRFGLKENYVIDWAVTSTRYETRQGQWYIEPRFELTLKRKQYDENGDEVVRYNKLNQPFHPRIIIGRASFFIDPPADMIEAQLAGLEDSGLSDKEMQERMAFWRYSLWIEERLSPKMPTNSSGMREEVINGKAYQIEEYSNPV